MSLLKSLKVLTDPNRLRMLLLLEREELSVAEVQEILSMGQSRISTHLAQLKQAGLLDDRRAGKNILYRLKQPRHPDEQQAQRALLDLARTAVAELPGAAQDGAALELVLRKRQDKARAYFDSLAGKFGREYVPGRSWKGLAETLLWLMPSLEVADLGAGEGTFSQLLARRARHVIAVDNSEKMVAYGARLAAEHGVGNLEYRVGDLERLPIADASIDLAFFSQSLHHAAHPDRAVAEAFRILKSGGRIAILDLRKHGFEQARELYADEWLGFSELELKDFLERAGFQNAQLSAVHKEEESPWFETLLAVAEKP